MKTLKLKMLIAFIAIGLNSASAQVYGVWNGAKEATFWNYDLSSGEGSYDASSIERFSVSGVNGKGFLPAPPTGSSRLFVPAATGGGFSIDNSELKISATSSGSPVKFSAYNIENATPITSLFFDINFNDTEAKNGVIILGIGKNMQGQVFNNTNQILNGTASKGLFGGLRFEFYGGSDVQAYYRTANYTNGNFDDHKTIFKRSSGKQHVEIYCNNSATTQIYKRGNKKFKISPRTMNVFVDGMAITANGSVDIPATGELASDQAIDAFVFNASNSVNNLLNFSLSNIKIGGL